MTTYALKLFVAVQTGMYDLREKLADRERGATAVEYGLMVAAIAAVIIVLVFTLGTKISTAFSKVTNNTSW